MPMTLPSGATLGLQSMTTRRYQSRVLLTLFCVIALVTGSPTKREMRTPHQHSKNQARGFQNVDKPAAHFQADPFSLDSLKWTSATDNSFSQGNLTLQNNKLVIKHAGLYFIYTQATFGGDHCPLEKKSSLSHSVILQSTEHEENLQLLHAQKTACGEQPRALSAKKPASTGWNRSIFQGAVFRLEHGDVLYTETKGSEYLKRENGVTYFGAYAL